MTPQHRFLIAALALLFAATGLQAGVTPPSREAVLEKIENRSVVRVNATIQNYDYFRPWQKRAPFSRRGLGVVIENGQVLVTAELVANATFLELERAATSERTTATVEVVDYDSNLALLRPTDEDFLKDMVPLKLDIDSRVGDRVEVLQLEKNGDIAVTPGTITTITVGQYPMDDVAFLTFRLSVPMQFRDNSFTVPVVRNGRLAGMLMRYDARSQSADLVPAPVIESFLKAARAADGKNYAGFPRAGIAFASLRDPQLREYVGLNGDRDGVYITRVQPNSGAAQAGIQKGDVLLAIDGKPIDRDGNYEHPRYGRIPFSHFISVEKSAGETIPFLILRNGEEMTMNVTLHPRDVSKMVSPPYSFDRAPDYVVLGGLVFMELERSYLREWGGNWRNEAPLRLVYLDSFQDEIPEDQGKIVFLSQILPSNDTMGYEELSHMILTRANGKDIKSLDDLRAAIAKPQDGFHRLEFADDPKLIILDADSVARNQDALRMEYGIPSLGLESSPAEQNTKE